MKSPLSVPCFTAVLVIGTLATSRTEAQNAPPARFGLGITGFGGWIATNGSVFVGGEGFVRVAGGAFWTARVDGAYFGSITPTAADIGCINPSPAPACDTRQLGQLGTLMATIVGGLRESGGLRHFYGLLGAGVAVTRWGGGEYIPRSGSGGSVEQGVGAGPTLAIFQGGIGSQFHLFGGNRIELRLHYVRPSTPASAQGRLGDNSGRSASLTIGRVW